MSYSTNHLIGRFLGDGPSDAPAVAVDIYGNPIYPPTFEQEGNNDAFVNFYRDNVNLMNNPDLEDVVSVNTRQELMQSTPAYRNNDGRQITVFATREQLTPQVVDTRIVNSLATFNAPASPAPAPPPVWAVGPQHPSNAYQAAAYQAWTPAPAPAPFFAAPAPAPAPAPTPASSGGGFTLAPPGLPVRPRPREGDSTVTYVFDADGNPVPVEPAQQSASGGKGWIALAALAALAFMS